MRFFIRLILSFFETTFFSAVFFSYFIILVLYCPPSFNTIMKIKKRIIIINKFIDFEIFILGKRFIAFFRTKGIFLRKNIESFIPDDRVGFHSLIIAIIAV